MSTNPPDRTDQIAALLQETVQITRSNAEARAANSSAIADTNAASTSTNQFVEGLVQVITEWERQDGCAPWPNWTSQ